MDSGFNKLQIYQSGNSAYMIEDTVNSTAVNLIIASKSGANGDEVDFTPAREIFSIPDATVYYKKLFIDNDRLVFAIVDKRQDGYRVHLVESTDGGTTTTPPCERIPIPENVTDLTLDYFNDNVIGIYTNELGISQVISTKGKW